MKIRVKEGKVTITAADGDTIIFHAANLNELSNALMILRQLKEHGPLDGANVDYADHPEQRRSSDMGGD